MDTISLLKRKPVAEHTLDSGRFVFYPNISVAEVHEGMHITFEKIADILMVAQDVYGKTTPFVYISNRINSYSIDPLGYYEAIKLFPNLKAYAIVSENKNRQTLALLEKLFIKKPIHIFSDLESAFKWSEEMISKSV
ncbi:MAG: hypothetical protein ACFCUL_07940 [Flavobacteriaceae bacterium]